MISENRENYWNIKYSNSGWGNDIHLALADRNCLEKEHSTKNFINGIEQNSSDLVRHIINSMSLYRVGHPIRVLDFGCGSGDFLNQLLNELPKTQAIGIDISQNAINKARLRTTNQSNVILEVGGVEALRNKEKIDVVLIREVYYLLTVEEREYLWKYISEILEPSGIIIIADLCFKKGKAQEIGEKHLSNRHFGGKVITWEWNKKIKNSRQYSIQKDAMGKGFIPYGMPKENEWAVYASYKAGVFYSRNDDERESYLALSNLALPQNKSYYSDVPYTIFSFTRKTNIKKCENSLGFNLVSDFHFKKNKPPVLRSGIWTIPEGKWSLILGRSGTGKSTFLDLLSSWIKMKNCVPINTSNQSVFYLTQNAPIIEKLSVEHNIQLFSKSEDDANRVMKILGLDMELRKRKADSRLSGGEKQRVALAQAVASHADILLLDEPCTGVDVVRKAFFYKELKRIVCMDESKWKPTVICVDHDYKSIENRFDFIFEIINGNLIQLFSGS